MCACYNNVIAFYCGFAAIVATAIAICAYFVFFFSTTAILLLTQPVDQMIASLLAPFLGNRGFLRDGAHLSHICFSCLIVTFSRIIFLVLKQNIIGASSC